MVEREFEGIWLQIEQDMKQAGINWNDEAQTEEEARAEYRGIAVRRVRLALLLSEIGRVNNITVPHDELNQAVMEQARRHPGKEQEVFDYFKSAPEAISGLHAPIFEDKVIDFIVEMSGISVAEVTLEELYRNPDAPESDGKSLRSEEDVKRSAKNSKGSPNKNSSVKKARSKAKSSSKAVSD